MKTPISGPVAANLIHGQLAVTATALAITNAAGIPTIRIVNGVRVKNKAASTAPIFVGGSTVTTANGYELAPGESVMVPCSELSSVYVIAAAAATSTTTFIAN